MYVAFSLQRTIIIIEAHQTFVHIKIYFSNKKYAIDFCYVADGIFDGFWEVSLNPWDICGGKLIVEEAGGLVTDFKGNRLDLYDKQILSSNGKIHSELIRELENYL